MDLTHYGVVGFVDQLYKIASDITKHITLINVSIRYYKYKCFYICNHNMPKSKDIIISQYKTEVEPLLNDITKIIAIVDYITPFNVIEQEMFVLKYS